MTDRARGGTVAPSFILKEAGIIFEGKPGNPTALKRNVSAFGLALAKRHLDLADFPFPH